MSGWFLIDGKLSPAEGRQYALRLFEAQAVACEELPIQPSGAVHEIVTFRQTERCDRRLTVRSLSWFECCWRMAYRVFRVWRRLAPFQRRRCGLTLGLALGQLPVAYRIASAFRGFSYADWVNQVDSLTPDDRDLIRADCALWTNPPLFRITLFAGGESSQRNATLTSLQRQFYRGFRWAEIDAPPSEGEWFLWLQPGDQLAEHSLYWLAAEIVRHPATLMIYADDDEIDDKGRRCRPRFKPDWSALHLQATDYIGRACVVNGSVLPQLIAASGPVLAAANLWPLLSALGRQSADRIRHVPAVLLHRAAGVDPLPVVRRVPLRPPEPTPQVSIIIPTRNALHLLRACVESVLNKTTYSNFELLIVDNGSDEAECLAYLACIDADPRVRVLPYRAPFNYSAINNFAAAQATGEVLCLLNNDTEVIATDWLDEMVALLSLEGVGAVGGKLYYPDGRVQHAGDTVGPGGCANHLHQFLAPDDQGYCQRASVVQDLSAVTAACLVTWRDIFQRLGGLNERHLPVAFNDVDYCLRLRQTGYRVVWSPDAALYHHESVSRGKDTSWRRELRSWREVGYMRRTWRQTMRNDPFYNPNFSYFRADFVLGPAPNVKRPWVEGME